MTNGKRERDKQKFWGQRIWVLWSILRHKNPKKQISDDDRFFGTRVKQYASARMAVGIKIWITISFAKSYINKVKNKSEACLNSVTEWVMEGQGLVTYKETSLLKIHLTIMPEVGI